MEEKQCSKCKEPKPITEFSFKYKAKGIRRSSCDACQATYHRTWYTTNGYKVREKVSDARKVRRKLVQKVLGEYLAAHSCVDCGFTDIRALDFDHVRGKKKFGISDAIKKAYCVNTVMGEIEKCEVRCKNCHAIRTDSLNGSWRNKSE